ncbi:hypothetical protein [Stenotrophomonas terrae]|uniref:hypothetical protein n=1 Tax=Stenotrophomonas terrae TaxID=405446 RepID=UPI00128EE91F|nr:hypothetical protein [Stenotrophomonas terrae]
MAVHGRFLKRKLTGNSAGLCLMAPIVFATKFRTITYISINRFNFGTNVHQAATCQDKPDAESRQTLIPKSSLSISNRDQQRLPANPRRSDIACGTAILGSVTHAPQ